MPQLYFFRLAHGDCIGREIIIEKSRYHEQEGPRRVRIERWNGNSAVVRVLYVDGVELTDPFRLLLTPTTEVYDFA